MNLDLLYTIPLYFGNDIVPKYIHYFFALATGLLLYRHLAARLNRQYGLLGALFFLSIPIIIKLSITVYVDLGLVFFTTAALLQLLRWAEDNFQSRFLLLAGLCCGLAAGTKYNGLISIITLTLLVPILYQRHTPMVRQSNGKALLFGAIFFAIALTTFSPWLIRNAQWTGNPIYPLYNSLFQTLGTADIDQQTESTQSTVMLHQISNPSSNAFVSRKILYNESWWQALLLPLRFFFEGQDDNPQFFDGKLTPFLLFLPAVAFVLRTSNSRLRREQTLLLSFSLLYFFLTFFQEALRIRYIVPIVPPLVILSMYGLQRLLNRISLLSKTIWMQKILYVILGFTIPSSMLLYNGNYISDHFYKVNPLPYLKGVVSKEEYITTYRPEYPAIQYANSILTPETKVLCLFMGNRGYFMDFQPVFEQPLLSGNITTFLEINNSKKNILEEMQQKNITHVLLRDDLTVSWFQKLKKEDQLSVAPLFSNASKPLFRQSGYTFYAIVQKNTAVKEVDKQNDVRRHSAPEPFLTL
jgi:hypothetical protein